MKKILIILILTIITLQVQAGRKELMEREKKKLLAVRELVLKALAKSGSEKDTDLKVKAELRETKKGLLIKIVEVSSFGKKRALTKETILVENTNRKKGSGKFYKSMEFINP